MANPQKENGYTAIANELLEHIYSEIKGSELSVLLVILRFIYGFHNRNEAELSYSFIAKATNISRRHACNCVKSLAAKNVISVSEKKGKHSANVIRFNKDYDSCTVNTSEPEFTSASELQFTQEKQDTKQDIKQEYCACAFFETLWSEYPNKKGKARVSKKSLAAINKIGYEEMHRALERYKASKPDWQCWQNGSTFFNSGYVDYLDNATESEGINDETNQDDNTQEWCCDGII